MSDKAIYTLEEMIEKLKECDGIWYIKQEIKFLEELKELREKYKNVSEAYMKCNLELFRLMQEKQNNEQ